MMLEEKVSVFSEFCTLGSLHLLLKVGWRMLVPYFLKVISVLSQVAWTAPSLLFLMSWGRCVFMDGKVSFYYALLEGGEVF